MKKCKICGEIKPASEYYAHATTKDRLHTYCKPCFRAYGAANKRERRSDPNFRQKEKDVLSEWRKRNPSWKIRKELGVSVEEYWRLIESTDNKCPICLVEFDPKDRNKVPCVDHDHLTGKVRGILCHKCNRSIGLIGDDNLDRAAEWVMRHRKEVVPDGDS